MVALLGAGTLGFVEGPRAAAQENLPSPLVRLDPGCVEAWTGDDVGGELELRVRGSGFEPGTTVALRFGEETSGQGAADGPSILDPRIMVLDRQLVIDDTIPLGDTAEVGGLGTFETSLNVFWPMGEGRYLVSVTTRGGGPSGAGLLLVPCPPSLEVGPDCPGPGADPTSARIVGRGFGPGSPVSVELWMGELARGLGEVEPGSDGSFSLDVPSLEALPEGSYPIVARQPRWEREAVAYLEFPCPGPRVRLRPDCGPPGTSPARMEVTVTGSGFQPGSPALVIWDPRGSHELWPARIAEDGGFSVVIRPLMRPDGRYAVRVENLPPRAAPRIATAGFEIPCPLVLPEPSIMLDPTCGRPALSGVDAGTYSLTVRGEGFFPGALEIAFDADASVEPETFPAEADQSGVFEVGITPQARPAGSYLVVAVQPGPPRLSRASEEPIVLRAEASFRVPCRGREPPPPSLDPVCGPASPGLAEAYRVTVAGSGYYRGGLVEVSFGRGRGASTFSAPTQDDGSYETVIVVGGRDAGDYPVRVIQRDAAGNELARAEAIFTVPCPTDPSDPRITIRPDAGPPGYTARVEGVDFPPGSTVTLTWDRGIGAGRPVEVSADGDGRFSVYLLILPNDFPGERTLRAGRPDEPEAFPLATDRYVVVAGTGMPPNADREGYVFRR